MNDNWQTGDSSVSGLAGASTIVVLPPPEPPQGDPSLSAAPSPAPPRHWGLRAVTSLGRFGEWCFGGVSLIVLLAVLATIPLLNLMSLGYLLEVSGRIVRTGRFSAGLVGFGPAARIGSVVLGAWLLFLPLRLLSGAWRSAWLIDPTSRQTQVLWTITFVATLVVGLHVAWACYRGGRLRHFLWPAPLRFWRTVRHGGMYAHARDETLAFLRSLRPWYYFSLGARGFVGTLAWLAIPVLWMMGARQIAHPGAAFVVSLPGMLLFAAVLLYLPFLQARFAAENRLRVLFNVRTVRRLFRHAPLSWWLALLVTLLFALPLYMLKIEMIDREIAWLPSLLFVIFIFPARMISGWAVARAVSRSQSSPQPAHVVWRWMARLADVPVVVSYLFFMTLFLYISWRGSASLLEQHAFLVPVPFLGG